MLLTITEEELNELYEICQVLLGGESVDVDVTKKEVKVLARRALKNYLYEIQSWQIRNQFSNVVGTKASVDFTNKFIMDNTMIAQRISDWFASMARVGGKIPWKKDYITLEAGKQVYNLATHSATPYTPGTRRINRIMWYARPEIFGIQGGVGAGNLGTDFVDFGLFAFGPGGLAYGAHTLGYLGNVFDVVLLAQAMELRNKVLRSEFFYNISGDMLELTPMPGSSNLSIQAGAKVFYYYLDEEDFINVPNQDEVNELIANPTQVKIDNVPYDKLNALAKNWIDNYTIALAKYVQGTKWRAVRKIASPGSDYSIDFDYDSLLSESKEERESLTQQVREELTKYDIVKLMEDKASVVENAAKINTKSPRKWFVG